MAEYGIGAGGDRRAGHFALVVGDHGAHEVDAPVVRDQHHVGLRAWRCGCRLPWRPDRPHAPRCGCARACRAGRARPARTACARAAARSPVGVPRPSRPAAGWRSRRGMPRACRRPAVRMTGLRAAAMFSPTPTTARPAADEVLQRFEEGLVAPVQAMVAGEGDDVEAGARQRGGACRLRHHGMTRLRQARAARGEAGFQLAEHQLGVVQQVARGGKAFVRVLTIRRQVARGQHDAVGGAHLAAATGIGSPGQLPGFAPQARSSGAGL